MLTVALVGALAGLILAENVFDLVSTAQPQFLLPTVFFGVITYSCLRIFQSLTPRK